MEKKVKVDDALTVVEEKLSALNTATQNDLVNAVKEVDLKKVKLQDTKDNIKQALDATSGFDDAITDTDGKFGLDTTIYDPDEATLTTWQDLAKEFKEVKGDYDAAAGAVTEIKGELDGATGDLTDALDAAEKAKVKSDKKTLKQLKEHEKHLKTAEKEGDKISIPEAEQAVEKAKQDSLLDTKKEDSERFSKLLNEALNAGGIDQADFEEDYRELNRLQSTLDNVKAKMRSYYAQKIFAENRKDDDGNLDPDDATAEAAQLKLNALNQRKTDLKNDLVEAEAKYDAFFGTNKKITVFGNEYTDDGEYEDLIKEKIGDSDAAKAIMDEAQAEVDAAQLILDAVKLGVDAAHDAKDAAHDAKSEVQDDLEDAKDDDDDEKDFVVVVKDFEDIVDTGSTATVDEDIDRAAACVEPILCYEAVRNVMSLLMFGDGRRLSDVVDDQDYCNEPDIVEAWGAGNDFAAFLDDDDDLDCIIDEAEKTLSDTTASRTRYLRGLQELTVDDLGWELLLKERDVCGHNEEEIECMDQWRCNIEEKCAEKILNGEDDCSGILDYVTACYIWCVEIL